MSSFDDSGLRKFQRKLESLAQTKTVSFAELFTPEFLRRHTRVTSFEELLELGGYDVNSREDFEAIPDADWERLVRANTSFGSWKEMQKTAGAEYIERRLA